MIKKICVFFLAMMMCLTAFAANVEYASPALDREILSARYGVQADENGDFAAMSPKAKAIETYFMGKIASYAGGGMLMFNVQAEGNFETGISYPVLRVLYAGSAPLNANTVMFSVGGEVYAARVQSSVSNAGRYHLETMKAYLTEEGFRLVESLVNTQKANITILGSDQYTQAAEKAKYYGNTKLEISAECLSALTLPEGTPDFSAYDLQALSEKAFSAKYGKMTEIEKIDTALECEYALDKSFFLAADNAPSATIRAVQELLKQNGFMVGSTGTQVNADMISAVKTAQAYYGLDVTGYADARLIKALKENKPVEKSEEKAENAAFAYSTEQISFSVDAWYLAGRVDSTMPGGSVSVSDKDNVFVVFEGEIASKAIKSLSLSWEVKAELEKDGKYVFPCAVYTEMQAGSALSTTLGVLKEGRLVIVCEIPMEISQMDGEWTLKLSEGGNAFEMNLVK